MFEILQTINTGKENPILTYEQPLECGDKNAHTWIVRVYDKNDMPVDLTGMNVIAYFSPREIEKSFSVRGSVQSNVAKVILDEKCYATPGRLTGVLQVSNVDDIVSMAIAKFRVIADINNQIVDTGDPIDDVQDLLAQIEAMKSATKAATDAAYQANLGAEAANAAAEAANAAAGTAGLAANAANNSASLANSAASNADEAAKRANTAAETIETATGAADEAAEAANQAAERANAAAAVVDENLEKVELNISEAGNVQIAAIQAAGAAQTQAVNSAGAAQQSAIENKAANALASIPEEYTALANDVSTLKDLKADVIADVSARANAHELHAQAGPMSVTLFGKTTETGTGDKSPENPYVISGVDAAMVRAGGKNLLDIGTIGIGASYRTVLPIPLKPGTYTVSALVTSTGTDSTFSAVFFCENDSNASVAVARLTRDIRASFTVTFDRVVRQLLFCAENTLANSHLDTATFANVQIEFGTTATDYEPYIANVITPPLLPLNADGTGDPLYGNGTVDDIVENDVLSGRDKRIVLDGGFLQSSTANVFRCDAGADVDVTLYRMASNLYHKSTSNVNAIPDKEFMMNHNGSVYVRDTRFATVDDFNAYLAANPLTVYYRSINYTPEKDLMVCRVTRKYKTLTLDGSDDETYTSSTISGGSLRRWTIAQGASKTTVSVVGAVKSNWLPSVTADNTWFREQGISINQNGYVQAFISDAQTEEELRAMLADNPLTVVYELGSPEVYATDPHELRKPVNLIPVTVTGSGETEVTYPHDTKHYIDSQIAAAVALALNG